ncbi:endonuclease V, partial [Neoconidiobolus thromboides FSU 785]
MNQLKENELKAIKLKWEQEQIELKKRLVEDSSSLDFTIDYNNDQVKLNNLHTIAGVDISFFKKENNKGIACLSVLSYPSLKLIHLETEEIELKYPYIAGYLAFREVDPILNLIKRVKEKRKEIKIQLIMVDGNGKFHPHQFGLACHLGVLANIPTIGVSKNFLYLSNEKNLSKSNFNLSQLEFISIGKYKYGFIIGDSGLVYGAALVNNETSKNPIFISQGHMIDLIDCIMITLSCCLYKIPEPIRQADLNSRQIIRELKY